jgi:hypothetical protein
MNNFDFDKPNPISIEEKFAIIVFTILMFTTLNALISMYSSIVLMIIFCLIKEKIIKWKK